METDGIVQVGEVPVVLRRMSEHAADHAEAVKAAKIEAYREVAEFAEGQLRALPPYTDPRPWQQVVAYVSDRMRDAAA